jgi:hypothetical protein
MPFSSFKTRKDTHADLRCYANPAQQYALNTWNSGLRRPVAAASAELAAALLRPVDDRLLSGPAPLLAMSVLGSALDMRVAIAEQQTVGRAHASPDQTEIARRLEEAGIPAPPSRQQLLDLISQGHGNLCIWAEMEIYTTPAGQTTAGLSYPDPAHNAAPR